MSAVGRAEEARQRLILADTAGHRMMRAHHSNVTRSRWPWGTGRRPGEKPPVVIALPQSSLMREVFRKNRHLTPFFALAKPCHLCHQGKTKPGASGFAAAWRGYCSSSRLYSTPALEKDDDSDDNRTAPCPTTLSTSSVS